MASKLIPDHGTIMRFPSFSLPSTSRQNNIDLLRALAVSAVFIHHAQHVFGGQFPFFGEYGGQFGPQLFFLISGYLITASWDRYAWREYLCHRLFRIMPAYLAYFLGFGWLQHVVTATRVAEQPGYFLANILLIQQLFPRSLIAFDVLHVTWTLTVELLWYASVPLFAWLLTKSPRITVLATVVLSTTWSALANFGALNPLFSNIQHEPGWIYLFASNHFVSQVCFFVFGAWVFRHKSGLAHINPLSALLVGLVIFLLRPYYFVFNPIFITGVGLAFFLVAAITLPDIKNRWVMLLSETSFSIYLCHFPMLLFVHGHFQLTGLAGVTVALLATLVVSFLTYSLIEKPGIQLGRRLADAWQRSGNKLTATSHS